MSTRSPHLRFGLVIAAIAFVLDQAAKWIVTVPLSLETKPYGQIELLPFFNLTWAQNYGISLSMFSDQSPTTRWTLVAVTGIVAAVAIVFLAVTGMPWSAFWGQQFGRLSAEWGLGVPKSVWGPAPPSALPPPRITRVCPVMRAAMSALSSGCMACTCSRTRMRRAWARRRSGCTASRSTRRNCGARRRRRV